jgi:hypothetical protein
MSGSRSATTRAPSQSAPPRHSSFLWRPRHDRLGTFHRHTFGSLAINSGSTREVQEWLGHADARTTARYVHFKRRSDEAKRLAKSFEIKSPEEEMAAVEEEAAQVRVEA